MFGSAGAGLFAGFVAGYLAYDTIHFLTHHRQAGTAVARMLKKRHYRHHYADSTRDYGVSSPLWDLVLGTLGGNGRRPRAETRAG